MALCLMLNKTISGKGAVEVLLDATDNYSEALTEDRLFAWQQKGELDVTRWQTWFLYCLLTAIDGARETLGTVLGKTHFWERFAKEPLNERQIKALNTLLDGFEDKLSTSKWAKLARGGSPISLLYRH